jgi:hypothetical protein
MALTDTAVRAAKASAGKAVEAAGLVVLAIDLFVPRERHRRAKALESHGQSFGGLAASGAELCGLD